MDHKIKEAMKKNDEIAINLLNKAYKPLIIYILQSFHLSQEDQEECIDDILLKIWNAKHKYNDESSLKNYVIVITRRVGLNRIRRNKHNSLPYENMDLFGKNDAYEDIYYEAIAKKLKIYERDLFYRYYYYFQSIDSIALELGVTYKSIESRLYRLRKNYKRY